MYICIIVPCIRIFITGDVDYEAGPFNFIINAGETFVPFNISIYNNDVFQGNKSFNLSIHSPSLSHKFSVQSDCMLTVVIMDDDSKLQ